MMNSKKVLQLGALVMIAASLASPTVARAKTFDLHCDPIPDENGLTYGSEDHYQIDLEAGLWCERRCESKLGIVTADEATIVLEDGEDEYRDRVRRVVSLDTGILNHDRNIGTELELNLRHACVTEEFGNWEPYLGRKSTPQAGHPRIAREDFLTDSRGNQIGGTVGFAVAVDSTGKHSDCVITQSSGNVQLDAHTCRLITERLRMLPAADRRGQPTDSRYEGEVHWFASDD